MKFVVSLQFATKTTSIISLYSHRRMAKALHVRFGSTFVQSP